MSQCVRLTFGFLALVFGGIAVAQTAPRYVYVSGYSPIYAFRVGPLGRLQALPSSGTSGSSPLGIAATSNGRYLYAAEYDSNIVEGFAITSTGRLRSIGTAPAGSNPLSVVATPSGKFLYIGNASSSNISGYKLNAQTGGLNELPGSPFPSGYYPSELAVDAHSRFLFAANNTSVSQFSINEQTGALTLIGNFPSGSSETWVALDKSGKFVYAANNSPTGDLYGYEISGEGLQLLSGFPIITNISQRWAASDAEADFVYIAQNNGQGEIAGYSVDSATGALTAVPDSPIISGQSSIAIALDSTGEFLYSVDYYGQTVQGYSINSTTGALSVITGADYPVSQPFAVTVVAQQ